MVFVDLSTKTNQTPNTLVAIKRTQTIRAKLDSSKGKQPRPSTKVSKYRLSFFKEVEFLKHPGGWLRSSHPLKIA